MENTKKDVQHEKIAKKGARIMIAAPQSGSGKTLITCALLQALKEKNYHLESFKCGPDYIDPMFHKTVLGISSRNLDPFFTEDSITRMLLAKGQDSRDLAVIEGVMGLYDGLGGIREEASSYALAKATNTPILLTVNARGIGRSLLALLSGFLQYDTAHLIKGVILNQTPSSFASVLAKEIEETFRIPVVASFPVRDDVRIESRHLGLVMPYELEDIQSRLKIASQVLCENANIEQILEIAKSAPKLEYDVESDIKHKITEKTIRIGVARDEAFCFYYEDNLDLLKSLGAKLIFFSPLHDDTLPKDLDGILFGGGYPELYLKELEENENGFFLKKHLKYFGTLSDRADRLMSRTVHLLEYAQQVKEAYQAQIDARQNSNMQFLTVLSTIFFPLTLITGWFGMNFRDMPGLDNGYPAVMALSVIVILICIYIFKKKKII